MSNCTLRGLWPAQLELALVGEKMDNALTATGWKAVNVTVAHQATAVPCRLRGGSEGQVDVLQGERVAERLRSVGTALEASVAASTSERATASC